MLKIDIAVYSWYYAIVLKHDCYQSNVAYFIQYLQKACTIFTWSVVPESKLLLLVASNYIRPLLCFEICTLADCRYHFKPYLYVANTHKIFLSKHVIAELCCKNSFSDNSDAGNKSALFYHGEVFNC